jgi:hypothetical protein
MSLDKAIKSGKEHRKEYRKPKSIDATCRNHGTSPYCRSGRKHKETKANLSFAEQLQEWREEHGN